MGSFVDARHHSGRWLVRMEDLDTPRVVPGSASAILRTLEAFGLTWDGEVEYQSRRLERYVSALEALRARGLTFECSCTRRELGANTERGYPGTCRSGPRHPGPTATRFRVPDERTVEFVDRFQGACRFDLAAAGDVIIRRRDGIFAYQLAVVVDDADQGITDVVRGADLLPSTAWQIALQEALGLPTPRYGHLPVVVEPDGSKLAKSRRSVPVDPANPAEGLIQALTLLRQTPPPALAGEPPAVVLDWAIRNWRPDRLQGVLETPLPVV